DAAAIALGFEFELEDDLALGGGLGVGVGDVADHVGDGFLEKLDRRAFGDRAQVDGSEGWLHGSGSLLGLWLGLRTVAFSSFGQLLNEGAVGEDLGFEQLVL